MFKQMNPLSGIHCKDLLSSLPDCPSLRLSFAPVGTLVLLEASVHAMEGWRTKVLRERGHTLDEYGGDGGVYYYENAVNGLGCSAREVV